MEINTKLITLVVILLTYFKNGVAIKCFDCNSANNSMCLLDLSQFDNETISKYNLLIDCSSSDFNKDSKEYFCRKIKQTILKRGLEAEVRVTRGCGWVQHKHDCYKADNEDHLETVCQCFKDNCNSANIQGFPMYFLLLAIVSLIGVRKICVN